MFGGLAADKKDRAESPLEDGTMNTLSPIDRLLGMGNIQKYDGDPIADARKARRQLDEFNQVNRIIADPEKARPSLSQILNETYTLNKQIINEALGAAPPKGGRIHTVV
jgi:hypothetical protein